MDKASGAYRTISEVGDELDIPQHVLRFWETRFPQIKPMKRSGGRRYYRPADVILLKGIRRLLYGEGYTIKGVQRILAIQGVGVVQRAGGASGEDHASIADIAAPEGPAAAAGASPLAGEAHPEELHAPREEADEDALASDALPMAEDLFQDHAVAVAPEPPRSASALSLDHRGLLRGALEDLSECARLLDLLREGEQAQRARLDET
jgi:DNA-binding transcriptional MerR regulator